jgi:hypothetical protein
LFFLNLEAADCFSTAWKLNSTHPNFGMNLVLCLIMQGRFSEAFDVINSISDEGAQNAQIKTLRFIVYFLKSASI